MKQIPIRARANPSTDPVHSHRGRKGEFAEEQFGIGNSDCLGLADGQSETFVKRDFLSSDFVGRTFVDIGW
jgi:hypothetical protein